MLWLFLFVISVILLIIYVLICVDNYWKNKGVTYSKTWPYLGELKDAILRKRNIGDVLLDCYNKFPEKRYYGTYAFNKPCIIVKDIDLIKKITVKDFDYFTDRIQVSGIDDPVFNKSLVALQGEKWRNMRNTLSPLFTGNKIRIMFNLITDCAKQLKEHFLDKNEEIVEVEMKEIMSKIATDIIATTAFGVKCNSLKENNEFYKTSQLLLRGSYWVTLKLIFYTLFPKLASKLGVTLISKKITGFFRKIVKETLKERQEKKINRPDMIHILMEAKTLISIDDIAAQGFLFFIAGFEVVSMSMSFLCYELAVNPDVQSKLKKEIDSIFEIKGENLVYEDVGKMRYLDMVVSEILRKWPPGGHINRECVRNYKIKGENDLIVEKGIGVLISIFGLQRDENYYPNPDKFDPERFNDNNKDNILSYSYLPFGIGPRNCIGSRLALLEIKVLIIYLLRKFEIIPVKKTEIPLKLSPRNPFLGPDAFWLGLKK